MTAIIGWALFALLLGFLLGAGLIVRSYDLGDDKTAAPFYIESRQDGGVWKQESIAFGKSTARWEMEVLERMHPKARYRLVTEVK